MSPSTVRSGELHGRALRDYHFRGREDAQIVLHSDRWGSEILPVSLFFRGPDGWFDFERVAIDVARGRVLDVGAGTGLHALELQRRGHPVTAVDVLPDAVQIMRDRGVTDARRADVFAFEGGPYDTILLLMNGSGIARTLNGLDRLLLALRGSVAAGGQVLVDSADLREGEPIDADGVATGGSGSDDPLRGRGTDRDYPGVVEVQLEYRGEKGRLFRELYVDPETLGGRAERLGWRCEVIHRGPCEGYLARLEP